jgi:hypothetical protein
MDMPLNSGSRRWPFRSKIDHLLFRRCYGNLHPPSESVPSEYPRPSPLLLPTWTTTIATPFVWSKNTLVAVVRRGVFDKKTFATLITISFCFGTIDGRQTQVPSSCEGGIYSLDFRRTGRPKASAGVDRHCPDLSSRGQSCQDNKSSHSCIVEHGISKV